MKIRMVFRKMWDVVKSAHGFVERARAGVPVWSRWAVGVLAVLLAFTTFGYLFLGWIGVEAADWGAFVYEVCRPLCHQKPGRSFHLGSYIFPLCARCTGMWLGITLGVAFAMVCRFRDRWFVGGVVFFLGMFFSGLDWGWEGYFGGESRAAARAGFGFLAFVGMTLAVSYDVLA
ncbi:MAG: DUF2085 domain-containing protein, partial [Polyangiaceae bacterium]|nr:DUF2085 domain-containing protein [Polyangiaceae bacterium]